MADYLGHIAHIRYLQNLRGPPGRARRIIRPRQNAFTFYSDSAFRRRYRLSKTTVRWIAAEIKDEIAVDRRGGGLTAEQQVVIALRFYATGCFHRVSGDLTGASESTVCRVIKRVSDAIAGLRPHYIKFPDGAELAQICTAFKALSGGRLCGVCGAIDCTHIRVCLPGRRSMGRFYCRKQFYSLNVQVVGDANLRIRNIVCRWPGATHDSRIFTNCNLKHKFDNRLIPGHMLGDGGYAATRYMLTPFRTTTTPAQERYNAAQIKARNSVERLFGVWKARFPCLDIGLRVKLRTAQSVVMACAVLHNIAIERRERVLRPRVRAQPAAAAPLPQLPVPIPQDDITGIRYRDSIVERYFT